jgi:hypothetical protein
MANVPSSPIIVTLVMEALNSSETLVLTKATWRNIPKDAIIQCGISLIHLTAPVYTLNTKFHSKLLSIFQDKNQRLTQKEKRREREMGSQIYTHTHTHTNTVSSVQRLNKSLIITYKTEE